MRQEQNRHLLAEGQEHHERLVQNLRRPLRWICAVIAALAGLALWLSGD